MKLFIPLIANISYVISRCSSHTWITIISRRRKSIKMASVRIRSQLNKLLSPIEESCCNCHIQSIFPIQRAFHKCSETYGQIPQSKEVTPKKLGDLLDAFHRTWASNHNHSSNLHPQDTIKFIKNIIINVPKLPGFLLKAIFLERVNSLKENIR